MWSNFLTVRAITLHVRSVHKINIIVPLKYWHIMTGKYKCFELKFSAVNGFHMFHNCLSLKVSCLQKINKIRKFLQF